MRRKRAVAKPQALVANEAIRPISIRIPAAVKMTGISRSRLFELMRDGEVESVKLGSARLIIVESLDGFLERLRSGHVPARFGDATVRTAENLNTG